MKMTKEIAMLVEQAQHHNCRVTWFTTVELEKHFGSDKLSLNQWLEAQQLIDEQDFYAKGHRILVDLRALGVDCKMDMQSNKLHCPRLGIFAYY